MGDCLFCVGQHTHTLCIDTLEQKCVCLGACPPGNIDRKRWRLRKCPPPRGRGCWHAFWSTGPVGTGGGWSHTAHVVPIRMCKPTSPRQTASAAHSDFGYYYSLGYTSRSTARPIDRVVLKLLDNKTKMRRCPARNAIDQEASLLSGWADGFALIFSCLSSSHQHSRRSFDHHHRMTTTMATARARRRPPLLPQLALAAVVGCGLCTLGSAFFVAPPSLPQSAAAAAARQRLQSPDGCVRGCSQQGWGVIKTRTYVIRTPDLSRTPDAIPCPFQLTLFTRTYPIRIRIDRWDGAPAVGRGRCCWRRGRCGPRAWRWR